MSQQLLGFYTLAELLRQQARPPLDVGAGRGWSVRVVLGRFLPNMFPRVNVWEDQLTFGFEMSVLRRFVARAAGDHWPELGEEQKQKIIKRAFPAAQRLQTAAPLRVVCDGERLFLDTRAMSPNPHDSFWLLSPLRYDSVAVGLMPMDGELVVTAPEGLIQEMSDACAKAFSNVV